MSIRGKLLGGFGAIIIVLIAFGIYVYNGVVTFEEISDKKAARYEQVHDLEIVKNINTSMILNAMDNIVKYRDGVVYDEYPSNINALFKEIYDLENELMGDADIPEKVSLIKSIMKAFRDLEPILKDTLPHMISNKVPSSEFQKIDMMIDSAGGEMEGQIDKLISIMNKELIEAENKEAQYSYTMKIFLVLTIIASIIISIILSIVISNKIANSVEKFQDGLIKFFKYLNRESNDVVLLDESSNDEIGNMSKVVNQNIKITQAGVEEDREFIDTTVKVLEEFEQGDLCQRIDISVNNPAMMQLKNVLNSMGNELEKNIEEILTVLEQYTHYNYMDKVETSNVKHHLYRLSDGVNLLGESITRMLVRNKRDGLTLDDSSAVLLKNVDILNTTSTEAAASLEETAAALEEITSTIVNNTQSVSEMASFANKVTKSVEEGQNLANQTTKSMDEINEQVTAINEAITVIDQIAFQTNILSLNAAVEAATAGEAGKGFAVVAGEVRNLAARSAEAASEIKSLVENATTKTNDGKQISDKMINGYTSLNENIKQTIDLITQVEVASKEQKSGIEQINDAVSTQDRQTQQIAAAASETYDIANTTSEISKEIVANVDKKDFNGKDVKVEKRAAPSKASTPTPTKSAPKNDTSVSAPTAVESQTSADEWESF